MVMAYCVRMRRSVAASGALLGALGGVAAGAMDFALAPRTVPGGLLLFLCALYGAAGSLAGLAIALVAKALGWATDLGALWRNAWAPETDGGSEGGRWLAYGLASLAALIGLGSITRQLTL